MKYLVNVPVKIIRSIVFVLCCLTTPAGFSKQIVDTPQGPIVITWDNIEAVVKGEHLRAILAAYEDFSQKVNPSIAALKLKKYGSDNLEVYVAKIENYIIEVRTGSEEGYTIVFRLKNSDAAPAFLGSGGATRYRVDPKTFKAVQIDMQK